MTRPIYTAQAAPSFFKRTKANLARHTVAPAEASAGDILGVSFYVHTDSERTVQAWTPKDVLFCPKEGAFEVRRYNTLDPAHQPRAAMLCMQTMFDRPEHSHYAYAVFDQLQERAIEAAAYRGDGSVYDILIMQGIAYIGRQPTNDGRELKQHIKQGWLQPTLDAYHRVLIQQPTTSHEAMELNRLFDENHSLFEKIINDYAGRYKKPLAHIPATLPDVTKIIQSVYA